MKGRREKERGRRTREGKGGEAKTRRREGRGEDKKEFPEKIDGVIGKEKMI